MASDKTAEQQVRDTIDLFFQALDTQDLALMAQVVAHDAEMVHIGTDAGEIWRGWEELRQATVEQFARLEYYKADVRDLSIHFSPSGDVAWYAHLLDARIKSHGPERAWQGARFTGVLAKRGERWRMVQTHVSIPESAQG